RRHTRSKRDWSSDVCSSDLRLSAPGVVLGETVIRLAEIASGSRGLGFVQPARQVFAGLGLVIVLTDLVNAGADHMAAGAVIFLRSEERRVGKECRSRSERSD